MNTNHKQTHPAQEVLEPVIRALCTHKDEVALVQIHAGEVILIDCDDRDCGKIAGKAGELIRSLAMVCDRIGRSHRQPVKLELKKALTREYGPRSSFRMDPSFDSNTVRDMVAKVCREAFEKPGAVVSVQDAGQKTIITIHPHPAEKVDVEFMMALNRIFWSLGRANGCAKIEVVLADDRKSL